MKYYSNMMNQNQQKFSGYLGAFAMVILLGLSACFNDDQYAQVTPIAYVSFYHGSPQTENLTITVDNRIYNHQTFEFGSYLDYGNFYTGNRQFSFKPAQAANSLLDTALMLKPDIAYSVFLTDSEQEVAPLVVQDSLYRPGEGKALLRLVHLSPDTPTVNLGLHEEDDFLFEELGFGEVTSYQNVTPGNLHLTLKTSAEEEAVVSASNVSLSAGRIYTLVVRGYQEPGSANNKSLSLQLIRNYPNF
ncbi:DUF4397 domain-containing protein [Pleomorphovibrio marinus]|uniref:DUF4397 domain-containing protein n=1 Tax=Pleomorphovibrio marinus TaxID=2164132 RepID=UPI0013008C25|nr:DUF4397 domain-containing protein [Pleomorphovibrio marinus]